MSHVTHMNQSFLLWGMRVNESPHTHECIFGLLQCNRLVSATATRCNTLQHVVAHCNTLQLTATHYNTLQHTCTRVMSIAVQQVGLCNCDTATRCNALQHAVTHCNTLQPNATSCNTNVRESCPSQGHWLLYI